MSQLSDAALQVAISQIGQKEDPLGSNWGHPVQDYLHSVGISFPASWCMALMYWSFEQAAQELGVANPLYKTGGVLAQWAHTPNNHVAVAKPGDVFIMDLGKGLGHTGIVESIAPGINFFGLF